MAQELVWPLPPAVYSRRFRRGTPASLRSLLWHPRSPGLRPANRGGSGLSQHLGKTPAPHARVTFPLLEGHTCPWRLSSVGRLPVQLSGWSLLGTVLYSGERCLGAGLHEDGGGPQAGHRGPEGSDSPEGAPCDDLLGTA